MQTQTTGSIFWYWPIDAYRRLFAPDPGSVLVGEDRHSSDSSETGTVLGAPRAPRVVGRERTGLSFACMQPNRTLSLDQIDLSDTEFWRLPPDVRDGAFATLRQERPVARFYMPPIEFIPEGVEFYAITMHRDILEASRTPEVFSSAR